ncbi:unnamed protein product [Bemisia tabaci]|uniref:RUN domain-containing protein n=1 Tax=Bemisia tabaci TaxID=7038 RepID=A0A9P0A1Z9_BEMTA|nr:unnamed protein product [Bemisia tabaci]
MLSSPSKRAASPEIIQDECRALLQDLRQTIETQLISQVSNVWNIFGGLNRLHPVVLKIFKHRSRVFNQGGEPDLWSFIQGLSWLQPCLAASPSFVPSKKNMYLAPSPSRHYDKASAWVYKSLEAHNLSQKLSWLLSDREHILSHYEPNAFLAQLQYSEAMLICLRALEQNQISFLADINSSLYLLPKRSIQLISKTHRRCSSSPEVIANSKTTWSDTKKHKPIPSIKEPDANLNLISAVKSENSNSVESRLISNSVECFRNQSGDSEPIHKSPDLPLCEVGHQALKKSSSLPNLFRIHDLSGSLSESTSKKFSKPRSVTVPNSPLKTTFASPGNNALSPSLLFVDYKTVDFDRTIESFRKYHENGKVKSNIKSRERKKDAHAVDINLYKKNHKKNQRPLNLPNRIWEESDDDTNSIYSDKLSFSSYSTLSSNVTQKKSFLEDAGKSIKHMKSGYSFPKPAQGQSLFSFLASSPFGKGDAELDRENAHFSVSDAMIAAIEQVKCNRDFNLAEEAVDDSDEEINHLKQRIRLRRKQKNQERTNLSITTFLVNDARTDTTTTDQSYSPISTSPCSSSESISSDGGVDLDVEQVGNLMDINQSGLSISLGSLYSEAELQRPSPPNQGESVKSAENVALSLLKRFKKKQLPAASELEWLISEQEVPQQLLPLPNSWPVSPDDAEDQDMTSATQLRGTTEWAPPRSHIIFTLHPPPVRRVLMVKQNYRCAGCGAKVEPKYIRKYRYCEYLGRYFCTSCHTNQTAILPSRVLNKWDFSKCLVSDFSFHLLEQMNSDPLFNVQDQNPNLFRKARGLERTRQLRWQLCLMKAFLITCRFATNVQNLMKDVPSHIIDDPDLYSLEDLTQVKSGDLPTRLKDLVDVASEHLSDCQLCQARGFICELCQSDEIIFPWQLNKVFRCKHCGACYHIKCFSSATSCPRCERISLRKKQKIVTNDSAS